MHNVVAAIILALVLAVAGLQVSGAIIKLADAVYAVAGVDPPHVAGSDSPYCTKGVE